MACVGAARRLGAPRAVVADGGEAPQKPEACVISRRRLFEKASLDINMERNGHIWRILAMLQWSMGGPLAFYQPGEIHEFGISASSAQWRKQGQVDV